MEAYQQANNPVYLKLIDKYYEQSDLFVGLPFKAFTTGSALLGGYWFILDKTNLISAKTLNANIENSCFIIAILLTTFILFFSKLKDELYFITNQLYQMERSFSKNIFSPIYWGLERKTRFAASAFIFFAVLNFLYFLNITGLNANLLLNNLYLLLFIFMPIPYYLIIGFKQEKFMKEINRKIKELRKPKDKIEKIFIRKIYKDTWNLITEGSFPEQMGSKIEKIYKQIEKKTRPTANIIINYLEDLGHEQGANKFKRESWNNSNPITFLQASLAITIYSLSAIIVLALKALYLFIEFTDLLKTILFLPFNIIWKIFKK